MGRVPIKDRARVRPTCPRCPAGPGAVDKGLPLPPSSHLHPVSPSILCRRAEVMPQHSSSCRIRVPPPPEAPVCGLGLHLPEGPGWGSAAVGSDLSRPWQVSWSPWASPGAGDKRQLQVEQPGSPQNKNKAPPTVLSPRQGVRATRPSRGDSGSCQSNVVGSGGCGHTGSKLADDTVQRRGD